MSGNQLARVTYTTGGPSTPSATPVRLRGDRRAHRSRCPSNAPAQPPAWAVALPVASDRLARCTRSGATGLPRFRAQKGERAQMREGW